MGGGPQSEFRSGFVLGVTKRLSNPDETKINVYDIAEAMLYLYEAGSTGGLRALRSAYIGHLAKTGVKDGTPVIDFVDEEFYKYSCLANYMKMSGAAKIREDTEGLFFAREVLAQPNGVDNSVSEFYTEVTGYKPK